MSKRTPGLQRKARDFYPTPEEAVLPLVPHLPVDLKFYEPCVGDGALVRALEKHAMVTCVWGSDIHGDNLDATKLTEEHLFDAEMFITNPPWDKKLLLPIIDNLVPLRPTWLLLPSDWLFNKYAAPYHRWIGKIVTMPRVVWIPGTDTSGFENSCWVYFEDGNSDFLQSGWGP